MATYNRTGIKVDADENIADFISKYLGKGLGADDSISSIRGPYHGAGGGGGGAVDIGILYKPDTNYDGWDRIGITVKTVDPLTNQTIHVEDYVFQITVHDTNGWHL